MEEVEEPTIKGTAGLVLLLTKTFYTGKRKKVLVKVLPSTRL